MSDRQRQPYPRDHASHMPILIGIGMRIRVRRVLELGAGPYSTPTFLNRAIFPDLTELVSVEKDQEWADRMRHGENSIGGDGRITLTDASPVDHSRFDLIFVDSAEASLRVAMIRHLVATACLPPLLVVHDTENSLYKDAISGFPTRFDFTAYDPETSVVWRPDERADRIMSVMREINEVTQSCSRANPDDTAAWMDHFRAAPRPVPESERLTVSVTMAAYHRHNQMRNTFETYLTQTRKPNEIIVVEDGYDDGSTESVCRDYAERLNVKYLCRRNRPKMGFSNPAIPRNIGIRAATGDILVIQNPEVRFTKPTDFANIVAPTEADPMISGCAPCEALREDGTHKQWYCDPALSNFNHFCQAYRRAQLMAIGGFDEGYLGYGWEDHSFCMRLNRAGIVTVWAKDVVTQHQWHPGFPDPNGAKYQAFNIAYSEREMQDILAGKRTLEANVGREWGSLDARQEIPNL